MKVFAVAGVLLIAAYAVDASKLPKFTRQDECPVKRTGSRAITDLLELITEELNVPGIVENLYALLAAPNDNMCILWSWLNGNSDPDNAFIGMLDRVAENANYASIAAFLESDFAGGFDTSIIRPTIDRFLNFDGDNCVVTEGVPDLNVLVEEAFPEGVVPPIDDILFFLITQVLPTQEFTDLRACLLVSVNSDVYKLLSDLSKDETILAISQAFQDQGFDDPDILLQLASDFLELDWVIPFP